MYFKQSNLEKDEVREGEIEGSEGRGQARGGGRRNTLRKASLIAGLQNHSWDFIYCRPQDNKIYSKTIFQYHCGSQNFFF